MMKISQIFVAFPEKLNFKKGQFFAAGSWLKLKKKQASQQTCGPSCFDKALVTSEQSGISFQISVAFWEYLNFSHHFLKSY